MKVSFDSIGEHIATFINAGAEKGAPVKVSAAGTVSGCAAGAVFDGVAVEGDGEYMGVALAGFVTVPYSGTAPTVGRGELAADGSGGVKVLSGGRSCLVVDVDSTEKTVTFWL